MNKRLRLAASLPLLLCARAGLAAPAADPPPEAVTPPGAAEVPPQPRVAAAAPAPVPVPDNESWSNVSHVNGTPVPVGERGNYLYAWKTTNVATNPLGWLVGFYGLSVSYALTDNVAIRADANLYRSIDSNAHGYEFGATAPIYLRRVYQGPFLEPGVLVRDLDTTDRTGRFAGPQVNIGWHWTFDSGLNVAVAVGAARRLGHSSTASPAGSPAGSPADSPADSPDRLEPTGYFRVGYAY